MGCGHAEKIIDPGRADRSERTMGYNLGVGQISFSPDGQRLAAANMDGFSKVWDLAAQTELLALPPVDQPAKAIAYNPDGTPAGHGR